MSKINRPVISLKRLIKFMSGKDQDQIVVGVGTVTDDKRLYELPALKVSALRLTGTAKARIIKAGEECLTFDQLVKCGGECLTFDQIAKCAPLGQNTDMCLQLDDALAVLKAEFSQKVLKMSEVKIANTTLASF